MIFSEPYETLPNYYLNNFQAQERVAPKQQSNLMPFSFLQGLDMKMLIPLVQLFLKNDENMDVGKLLSSFQNNNNKDLISNLMTNPEIMKLATKMISGRNQSKKETKMESTDFEIKDYVRVQ